MKRFLRLLGIVVGVLVVVMTIAGLTYSPNTEIPTGLPGRHIIVNGVPIRVLQEGEGPNVLLIHGSPGSLEDWSIIRRALSKHARVTSFDRPNNGFSGATGDYSLTHNADFALAVIDALKLDDVTVVGHSYGGATALAMALRSPPRVRSYVILDSASYAPARKPTALYHLMNIPVFGAGFARVVASPLAGPRIADGIREIFKHRTPKQDFLDLRKKIWSSPKMTCSIAAETIGYRRFLAEQNTRYVTIRQPVHIVAQADDPFRREAAEHLHRDVPVSTLRLLPGTGHYVQFEKPHKVLHEIRAALKADHPVPQKYSS